MPPVQVYSVDERGSVVIHKDKLEVFIPNSRSRGVSDQYIINIDPETVAKLKTSSDLKGKEEGFTYEIFRHVTDEVWFMIKGKLVRIPINSFRAALKRSKK